MFASMHPLITQDAGRIKSDPLNEERIQNVLTRYEQWAAKNGKELNYIIDSNQLSKARVIFPLAGFSIGLLSTHLFVHNNSKYIGKFFILFTTYLGYKISQRYRQAYNNSRYFGNFAAYPKDIQRMIDNNDARYAFRWMRKDYLSIEQ